MKVYLITCKTKHALYERVESIGCVDTVTGADSRLSEDEAIRQIEAKIARFIVRDDRGNEATVEIEEREGRKYLITRRDQLTTDNLLAMPDCAAKPVVTPPPFRPVQPARSHCAHRNWSKS
jgi:hypothetical protein